MSNLRFGIIGVGTMGSVYAGLLREGKIAGAELGAVCDADTGRTDLWNSVAMYDRADLLINDSGVDVVIVATPHYDHVPLASAALDAGLHVVVDKPIAPTKRGAETLLQCDVQDGQIFAAMFNQRTDPRYIRLRDMIQSGELGRIQRINWIITDWFRSDAYYASGGWRATWKGEGGGVLLNQCPHQLDLWQWLFGMPARVRAFCGFGRYHNIEVEDDVTAYLEYADGGSGVFITTTGEAPGTNRLEIAADMGRVVVEGTTLQWIRNRTATAEWCKTTDKRFGAPETETTVETFENHGEQHAGILKNVVAAIRGEAELISPAIEGIHSVELANAMIYSGFQHETIDLPLDSNRYEEWIKSRIEASTR